MIDMALLYLIHATIIIFLFVYSLTQVRYAFSIDLLLSWGDGTSIYQPTEFLGGDFYLVLSSCLFLWDGFLVAFDYIMTFGWHCM